MGFFSWNCSLSDTSIPAPYDLDATLKKHNRVMLFLANGDYITGNYDGYGRIDSNYGLIDIFAVSSFIKTAVDNHLKVNMMDYIKECFNDYNENPKFDHFNSKGIKDSLDGSLPIKIVKEMYFLKQPKCSVGYSTLEPSTICQFQGYFYDNIYLNVTGKKQRIRKPSKKDMIKAFLNDEF